MNSPVNFPYQVLQIFKSKKNRVTLISREDDGAEEKRLYVLKQYTSNNSSEIRWLRFLNRHKLRVPEIIAADESELLLQYLPGETLCDYFTRMEAQGADFEELAPVLEAFSLWLIEFYWVARMEGPWILGDVNLRNFILGTDLQVYGVDFEDCTTGKVEEDAGKICAFALTYSPAFTVWKEELTRRLFSGLVRVLSLDVELVRQEFLQELQAIQQRRGLGYNSYSDYGAISK